MESRFFEPVAYDFCPDRVLDIPVPLLGLEDQYYARELEDDCQDRQKNSEYLFLHARALVVIGFEGLVKHPHDLKHSQDSRNANYLIDDRVRRVLGKISRVSLYRGQVVRSAARSALR